MIAALVLSACQQPALLPGEELVCDTGIPAPGTVRVAPVDCRAQLVAGGEGSTADTLLANHTLRVVLRHPQSAITLAGVGGATVIDAAPWGRNDDLHEAVPLVGGGWLDIEEHRLEPDGVVVAGSVVALPDRDAPGAGTWREVRYELRPDESRIRVHGADGLWIHAAGNAELLEGQLFTSQLAYGHDGTHVEDLGGAIVVANATELIVLPVGEAWSELAGPGARQISGTATRSNQIALFDGDELVGTIPVVADAFSSRVPGRVDGVRAEGNGRAPSKLVAPGTGLELRAGARGWVRLGISWDTARPRPVVVRWTAADGRSGVVLVDPTGQQLSFGAGDYTLSLEAGPDLRPRTFFVELEADETLHLDVAMVARFDPGSRVLARLPWPSDRSPTHRATNLIHAVDALAGGATYAVFAPENDVASVASNGPNFPRDLRWRAGSLVTKDGWSILAWPWRANAERSAHGGVNIRLLDPLTALGAASGGARGSRWLAVDLPWLQQAGAPFDVAPQPDFVRLGHPGPDGSSWAPWFAWLDAGVDLVPTGPATWVEVPDPEVVHEVDVEGGMLLGQVCATTGPLLELEVDGAGPGDIIEPRPDRVTRQVVRVTIHGGEQLDRAVLLGPGGAILRELPVTSSSHRFQLDEHYGWLAAAAWDSDGAEWAVTGPVWRAP